MVLNWLDAAEKCETPLASVGVVTALGHVRTANEDRYVLRIWPDGSILAVVADGMGGHQGGEIAAEITVETFASLAGSPVPSKEADAYETLLERFYTADARIEANLDYPTMGATIVAAIVSPAGLLYQHAGDTRLYLLRDGRVLYRSTDHSVAQLAATKHRTSSLVTSCVGGPGAYASLTVDPEWRETGCEAFWSLRKGDQIILCSDGLWSNLDDDDISRIAFTCFGDPSSTATALSALALEHGGDDNITVIAIDVLCDLPSRLECEP